MTARKLFLSFLGSGYIRPAPGTWGSLAAIPAAWLVWSVAGPWAMVVLGAALYFGGVVATKAETAEGGDHDPSWIVIDEVVGQWIALLPIAFGATRTGAGFFDLWPGVVAAFLMFRLFDIWKPWLVGRADARGDATGVMLDDVIAGVFAAIVVIALAWAAHAGFVAAVPDQM